MNTHYLEIFCPHCQKTSIGKLNGIPGFTYPSSTYIYTCAHCGESYERIHNEHNLISGTPAYQEGFEGKYSIVELKK